jgi:hypothetical protein
MKQDRYGGGGSATTSKAVDHSPGRADQAGGTSPSGS